MARQVDKEKKKEEIILAALKVFAEKGFYKTTIADISKEAGIGKGTVYEYFRTKEEILGKGFKLLAQGLNNFMDELENKNISPLGKIQYLIENTFTEFTKFGDGLLKVIMDFWAEGVKSNHPDILGFIDLKNFYQRYREMIAKIIQEGIEKGEFRSCNAVMEASILIASMDGLTLQWIMDPELFTIEDLTNSIIYHFTTHLKKYKETEK